MEQEEDFGFVVEDDDLYLIDSKDKITKVSGENRTAITVSFILLIPFGLYNIFAVSIMFVSSVDVNDIFIGTIMSDFFDYCVILLGIIILIYMFMTAFTSKLTKSKMAYVNAAIEVLLFVIMTSVIIRDIAIFVLNPADPWVSIYTVGSTTIFTMYAPIMLLLEIPFMIGIFLRFGNYVRDGKTQNHYEGIYDGQDARSKSVTQENKFKFKCVDMKDQKLCKMVT